MTMTVNGYRLRPIDSFEARKLEDGAVVIVMRFWQDAKTYAVTRREYYRTVVRRKKTVAGMEEALYWEPDPDWTDMPTWQLGWIWLESMYGREFFVIEGKDEWA